MHEIICINIETKPSRLEQENGRLHRKGVLGEINFLGNFNEKYDTRKSIK